MNKERPGTATNKIEKFGNIFVELNGKMTNIRDLNKDDYEDFIQKMRLIMAVYHSLNRFLNEH